MIRYGSVCSGVEAASLAWRPLGWQCQFVAEIDKFPAAVLRERFPEVPNLGDMTKIKIEENDDTATSPICRANGPIDLLVGGTPCFVAGTMILTEQGYRPIEDIRVGDMVLTDKFRLRRVVRTGSKEADVVKVKIVGRPEIVCTPNHPFLVTSSKRDNRRKSPTYGRMVFGNMEYLPVGECNGMHASTLNACDVAIDIPVPNFPKFYNATARQTAQFIGWYLGDGYIRRFSGRNKKCVTLCLNEEKLARFADEFKDAIRYCVCDRVGKTLKVIVSNTAMADFLLEHFGEHAADKRIPPWCYADIHIASEIINGYMLTDGYTMDRFSGFTTVSPTLAYGMADLLGTTSISLHFPPQKRLLLGRIINQRPQFICKAWQRPRKLFPDGRGHCLARITSVEEMLETRTVFNIEVEEDHTYVAAGVFVHNCQSYSVAGKREGNRGVSGLSLDYIRLAYESHARWVVWENVPGVFSSTGGLDFAAFLSGLCGWEVTVPRGGWKNAGICANAPGCYGVAWRVLDAQYTRVPGFPRAIPQRRRRVFLVGYRGQPVGSPLDWQRAAEVLFDGESLSGDPPPRGKARKGTASSAEGCAGTPGRPWDASGVNPTLNQSNRKSGGIGASDQELFSQQGAGLVMDNKANPPPNSCGCARAARAAARDR